MFIYLFIPGEGCQCLYMVIHMKLKTLETWIKMKNESNELYNKTIVIIDMNGMKFKNGVVKSS